jgi:hypothetical protein
MKLDGEDPITEDERTDFSSLVRNDRFDAAKLMLMRDIATFSQEPIFEQRDSHGNTAIILAAQQVFMFVICERVNPSLLPPHVCSTSSKNALLVTPTGLHNMSKCV